MIDADILIVDTLADAMMIVLAQRLAGMRPRARPVLAGAACGALAAQLSRALALGRGLRAALWLPVALGMAAVASRGQARRRFFRDGVLLLCAAGLMGGVVQALGGATGSLALAYALGLAAAGAMAAQAMRARGAAIHAHTVPLVIAYRGRRARIDALADSGNLLRDYLTGRPVIVLPESWGRRCLVCGHAGLRPIFADTAGGRQMMWCFTPDEVLARSGGGWTRVHAAAALAPGVTGMALLPGALLGAGGQGGAAAGFDEGE